MGVNGGKVGGEGGREGWVLEALKVQGFPNSTLWSVQVFGTAQDL